MALNEHKQRVRNVLSVVRSDCSDILYITRTNIFFLKELVVLIYSCEKIFLSAESDQVDYTLFTDLITSHNQRSLKWRSERHNENTSGTD